MNSLLTFVGKLLWIWIKLIALIVIGFIALIFTLTWDSRR
jgi:hypothetical protein